MSNETEPTSGSAGVERIPRVGEVLRHLPRLYGAGGRRRAVLLIALALIASFVEAAGAIMVVLVLTLVADPKGALDVPLLGDLRDRFPHSSNERIIQGVVVFVAIFFVLRGAFLIFQQYVQQRVIQNAGLRLGTRLFRGYLSMPYAEHLRRNSSELIRNVLDAVQAVVGSVMLPAIGLMSSAGLIAALLVTLLIAAPLATGGVILIMGPTVYVLLRVLQPRIVRLGNDNHHLRAAVLQSLQQSFNGIGDIRVHGATPHFVKQFEGMRARLARQHYTRAVMADFPRILLEVVLVLVVLVFLGISVKSSNGLETTIPTLGLFAYTGLRILPMLNVALSNVNDIRHSTTALGDLLDDLAAIDANQLVDQPTVEGINFEREIAFENVTFRYPASAGPAVSNVSMRMARGGSYGFVGPTGGGKSTVVGILIGLLQPGEGRVAVDGQDLWPARDSWHQQIGVVQQTVFLLDDSIRRNIAFGLDDDDIDESRVAEAVHAAHLDDFVDSLPEGLDSLVGERGVRLSGGQRQRIAIARALFRRPSVVVFDEGTSALDNVTEAHVTAAIEDLRGNVTVVMVAHRLSTVRRCDRIFVVRDGRIADEGTYDELAGRNEEFRVTAG